MRKAVYDNETHHYHIVDYFKGDNLKEDYCIMARLVTGKDNILRINYDKYIVKEDFTDDFVNKSYDLHICPDTDFFVETVDDRLAEYTLYLFLMDSHKKIIQIPEKKVAISKKVFETLIEEDLDFTCENYTETRNKIFTESISEPYVKDAYAGGYTWDPSHNWDTNYICDPRTITASTDSSAGKPVVDLFEEWSKLLGTDNFNKLQEMATSSIVTRPGDILANKVYNNDNYYKVDYVHDDKWSRKS